MLGVRTGLLSTGVGASAVSDGIPDRSPQVALGHSLLSPIGCSRGSLSSRSAVACISWRIIVYRVLCRALAMDCMVRTGMNCRSSCARTRGPILMQSCARLVICRSTAPFVSWVEVTPRRKAGQHGRFTCITASPGSRRQRLTQQGGPGVATTNTPSKAIAPCPPSAPSEVPGY